MCKPLSQLVKCRMACCAMSNKLRTFIPLILQGWARIHAHNLQVWFEGVPMARHRSLTVLALLLSFAVSSPPLFAQIGNPFSRGGSNNINSAVSLQRDLPPVVNLENTRIKLEVTAAGTPPQYTQTLQTKLTTSIQGDKRFIVDPQSPNTLVNLTVLKAAVSRGNSTTTVAGKQVQITRVTGNIQTVFQVIDVVTKKPMDSTP